MLIDSLPLDNRIKTAIIEHDGIKELYPPQAEAIKQGLLTGKNFVITKYIKWMEKPLREYGTLSNLCLIKK